MDIYVNELLENISIKTVEKIYNEIDGVVQDKKTAIDICIRQALLSTMAENEQKLSKVAMQICLLCLTITESKDSYCNTSLPFYIISDVFDSIVISECLPGLEFLSNILPRLLMEPLYSAGKYHLLRVCNDLLKRLSKVQEYSLCGRIQMILSKIFPLNEKSALNLTSDFNSDKISYVMLDESPTEKSLPFDTTITDKTYSNDFYTKLWGIQDCLNNPSVVFMSESSWITFVSDIETILQVFQTYANSPEIITNNQNQTNFFFPKYISNPQLIALQMDDVKFRQQMLFQFLIILSHFRSKGRFQSHDLSPHQIQWCSETIQQIYDIFSQYDKIYGCNFFAYVSKTCKNEEIWSEWKNDGCPNINIPKSTDPSILKNYSTSLDLFKYDYSGPFHIEHSPRLNYLWNICPDNALSCKTSRKSVVIPHSITSFLYEHSDKLIFDNSIEVDQRITNKSWFQWRVLRLLARHSSQFFLIKAESSASTVASCLDSILPSILSQDNKLIEQ